ncbi:ComEA family DNA-binding protein [Sphingobacterium hotanense]|uniref:ComEA family DNA-binding protein n=1 Tax=Sphingobacterium hotanense TaxID=649196 RepID=UPI0011F26E4E|nr:helix-hairpin-helix domain-containing protein [Sphingobacterium hotanense]
MNRLFAYFRMRREEQIGFSILAVLIVILLFCTFLYDRVPKKKMLSTEVRALAEDLVSSPDVRYENSRVSKLGETTKSKPAISYFFFDPNGLSVDEWKRLGLSERKIRVIHNYEAKGGHFRKPEDVAKLYSLTDEDVARLLPYVRIAEKEFKRTNFERPIAKKAFTAPYESLRINLNTADSAELTQLRGIGPAFSRRIVRFRELLGGFYSTEQLSEVYGLPEETFLHIKQHLQVDEASIVKLKINDLDANALSRHPYISYKQARTIVNYREHHGAFSSMDDLKKILSLDEAFFRKIEIYLDFK